MTDSLSDLRRQPATGIIQRQGKRIKFMDSGSAPGMAEPDCVIPLSLHWRKRVAGIQSNCESNLILNETS